MTSRSTSAPARSTSASPAATCCSTRGPTPRRSSTLGFARSTFRFAGPAGRPHHVAEACRASRSPPPTRAWSTQHLAEHGVTAEVVRLDGAVESAVQLGVADVIADVVETGTTLRHAGLEIFGEPILRVRGGADPPPRCAEPDPQVERAPRRLQGVLVARQLRDDGLRRAGRGRSSRRVRAHPGPGVADRLAAARQGLGRRARHGPAGATPTRIMDELCDVGARAILVTDIHACRL